MSRVPALPASAPKRGATLPVRVLLAAVACLAWTWPCHAEGSAAPSPAPVPTPNFRYPDSCHLDFGFLRDAQALRRGFLRVGTDGHFCWDDGTRARFWGVNIANRNLWISHGEIDAVVGTLARSGVNLLRFEALDSRGGLLERPGRPGTRCMDAAKLEKLQYWISRLREHGICYYLDLVDFREFTAADGVPEAAHLGRGARPYLFFDERLIELQKEFANQLLTTVNPYTGLAPVQDPALVLVEICNESGFFINPAALDGLVEPYRGRLQKMWNDWLRARYPTRGELRRRWGTLDSRPVLADQEDPLVGSVSLPTLTSPPAGADLDRRRAPYRRQDGVEFLYLRQRAYFKTMRDHLRSIGLRVPVSAVVSNDVAPDLASVAAECDFLAENSYSDHPRFAGKDWEGKFFHDNRNPTRDAGPRGFAPYTATLRWKHKPVVVREWATVWPNRYRCISVPEAAAYGRLLDHDALILFSYKTGDVGNVLVEFGYQADPTVWGLFGLGAVVFLRGDVPTAEACAEIVHTPASLFGGVHGVTDVYRLAWIMRVVTRLEATPEGGTDNSTAGGLRLPAGMQPLADVLTQAGIQKSPLPALLASGVVTSLDQSIVRRTGEGRLEVGTPRACAVAGELPRGTEVQAGALGVRSASEVGAVMAVSLDGLPLAQSRRYVVKMVTVAQNTGQKLMKAPEKAPADYVLMERGVAPVRTDGVLSRIPTVVRLEGTPLVNISLANGTWELVVEDGRAYFWCDTPGVPAEVMGQRLTTSTTRVRVR